MLAAAAAAAAAALAPLCTCMSQTLVWPQLVRWPGLIIDASGLSVLLCFAVEWRSIFIPNHPSTQQRFYSFLTAAFMRIWGPRIPHINKTLTECSLIAGSLIIGTSVSCGLCYCFHPVRFSHGLRKCRGVGEVALLGYVGSHFILSLSLKKKKILSCCERISLILWWTQRDHSFKTI